jgi:predicted nucleotidyltransferase component of viral defense system
LGGVFEEIAESERLDFVLNKADRDFVELGGSNKFCTFKLWYGTGINRSFIKVQINFVEVLCFNSSRIDLSTFMDVEDELIRVFPEEAPYYKPVSLLAYDPREILCEKIRAILTRRGIKARDFVDLFMLKEKMSLDVSDQHVCMTRKITFMPEFYAKYRENIHQKKQLLREEGLFE